MASFSELTSFFNARSLASHLPRWRLSILNIIIETEFSDDELSIYWDQLSDILIKLGDNSSDIVALKKSLMELGQPNVNVNFDDSQSEFTKLKEEANKLFKVW